MSNNIPDETSENFRSWIWSQFGYEPHEKLTFKTLCYYGSWSRYFVIEELKSWQQLNLVILPKNIDTDIKDNDEIIFLGIIHPTNMQINWFPWAPRYREKLEVSYSPLRPSFPAIRIGNIESSDSSHISEGVDYYPDVAAPIFLWSVRDNIEQGTLVTASDALRFTPMFKRNKAEWFLPFLERMAKKESIPLAEITSKYRDLFQKEIRML